MKPYAILGLLLILTTGCGRKQKPYSLVQINQPEASLEVLGSDDRTTEVKLTLTNSSGIPFFLLPATITPVEATIVRPRRAYEESTAFQKVTSNLLTLGMAKEVYFDQVDRETIRTLRGFRVKPYHTHTFRVRMPSKEFKGHVRVGLRRADDPEVIVYVGTDGYRLETSKVVRG